ncbi:hypothetical protein XENORESO_004386, partial [Xenotaenia resolanae]
MSYFHWLDKITLPCIHNCQFPHLFFFLQIFQDSLNSELQSCCSTFLHFYHLICDNVLVCVWFVQESRSASRSASPRGSGKSASRSPAHSPARSKDGSHHSRSKSWSRSRSGSHSHRGSRKHYSHSRSRSRSYRRRSHSRSYSGERRHRSFSHSPMSNRRRHIGNRANPDPNACLGVFGLSLYTTERDLRDVFSKYGPLADVCIVYDQQSRRSRGFAFVYFENKDDAKE